MPRISSESEAQVEGVGGASSPALGWHWREPPFSTKCPWTQAGVNLLGEVPFYQVDSNPLPQGKVIELTLLEQFPGANTDGRALFMRFKIVLFKDGFMFRKSFSVSVLRGL